MPLSARTRRKNPRLGIYFGIFTSAFVAITLLALIFEQLGAPDILVRSALIVAPMALLLTIAIASATTEPIDYYAAGRRVPAVYCGLGLAMSALGATGLASLGGAIFFAGFDVFCIINAGLTGFVVMAIFMAPFFRKFGAFTIPTYLGRRYGSHVLRISAAAFLAVPTLLILVAELQIGAKFAHWLTGQPEIVVGPALVVAVLASVALGGIRSLTWTNVASSIAIILTLAVPVSIAAVMAGYLPVPQLTHGPVLRDVGRLEAIHALPIVVQTGLSFELPSQGFHVLTKRFSEPFSSISPLAYILITFTLFTGFASAPWLLPRVATAPGVYEARKSLGWAAFFFAVVTLTVSTIVVFLRHMTLTDLKGSSSTVPDWMTTLAQNGLAKVAQTGADLSTASIAFDRDSTIIALPIAAHLPMTFAYLAAAGIVFAAFVTAGATASTLANLMSEDIAGGLTWKPAKDRMRRLTNQVLLIVVTVFAGAIVIVAPTDPLKLMLWALAITGSCVFPILIASVWWKRANKFGAFASIVTGFTIAVMVIVAGEAGWTGVNGVLAGVIALPMSTLAMVVVSMATYRPAKAILELLRDIRIPGGEIVYDRETRLMKLKERTRPAAGA